MRLLALFGFLLLLAAGAWADEIARLPDGEYAFEDAMDDGTPVCVRIGVSGSRMHIDFTGTLE